MESTGRQILIFGGTSEGRELAEYAAKVQVPVLVSVVTEYGEELLPEDAYVSVRQGALDDKGLDELLSRECPSLVLDATHPYASVISAKLKELCDEKKISYERVIRTETKEIPEDSRVHYVKSPEEAALYLKQDNRNVLLTTGTKDLEQFTKWEHLKDRIYARVLPDSEGIAHCEQLGIKGKYLIAMQGPFSAQMNGATVREVNAGWLVTKESGSRGGFGEKIKGALQAGADVIVISRPTQESGISLEQAQKRLEEYNGSIEANLTLDNNMSFKRKLTLIGAGMGGGNQLTQESLNALEECDAVLGAKRLLQDLAPVIGKKPQEAVFQPEKIVQWILEHSQYDKIAVVYSGDTGFYSGATGLCKLNLPDYEIRIYPGISSVSALCAAFQIPWEDCFLASAHGRECDVATLVSIHRKVFLLLGGDENLSSVCRKLTENGLGNVWIRAGVRMGYENQKLIEGPAEMYKDIVCDDLTAVVLEREGMEVSENHEG